MAKSFSMATMVPLMTWPSWGDWVTKLCSSMAAKSSRLGVAMELAGWLDGNGGGAGHIGIPVQSFMPNSLRCMDFPSGLPQWPPGGWVLDG